MGRVGSLALALGIGAAIVGGAGVANADDAGGSDTGNGKAATTDSPTATDPTGQDSADKAPSDEQSAGTVRTAASPTVPTMKLGTSNSAASVAEPAPASTPTDLSGLVTLIPQKIVEALVHEGVRSARTRGGDTTAASDEVATVAAVSDIGTTPPSVRQEPDTVGAALRREVQSEPEPVRANQVATAAPATSLGSSAVTTPAVPQPVFVNPAVTVVSSILSALGFPPAATNTGGPTAPMPLILGVLQLLRREIENLTLQLTWPLTTTSDLSNATTAVAADVPAPSDEMPTAYGEIGKWMLQPNGQIANYGGLPHDGRQVLEPVNVIIVDPNSHTPEQAAARLNEAMFWSGFPAQPIHSDGFQGTIDEISYGQQPNLPFFGYSDNLFVFPNNHGRIFGPDPVEIGTGYVWSGAFSTEALTIYNWRPTHEYVSYNAARTALATRLILNGRATYGGMIPLDNAYNTAGTTTGDHDGYAVVLVLR